MNILNLINTSHKVIKAVNSEFFTPDIKFKTSIPQHSGGGKRNKLKSSKTSSLKKGNFLYKKTFKNNKNLKKTKNKNKN